MGRKKYFLTIDTETTQTGHVADFGAVISDKAGSVYQEIGVLTGDFFSDRENHPLFHVFGDKNDVFSKASLPMRYANYENMLQNGQRMLASVAAINRWLMKARLKYNPTLTAYNLAFDKDKCANSGIDLTIFESQFCLWHAAVAKWGNTREYRAFCLQNHYFGNRTRTGHMGMQTKADRIAKFLYPHLPDEPHTALEDARDYEVPILTRLVKNTSPSVYMYPPAYNYRDWALRELYIPK